jgi:hypothetical protein
MVPFHLGGHKPVAVKRALLGSSFGFKRQVSARRRF